MDINGKISTNLSSTAANVVLIVVGCLVLYVAFRVGHFLLKMLFGLLGVALLVTVFWWLFLKH